MIKREDLPTVQSLHTDTCPQMEAVTKWEHKLTLDLIYDSIGSCGVCEHSGMDKDGLFCTRIKYGNCNTVTPDWFCADFERKTNED